MWHVWEKRKNIYIYIYKIAVGKPEGEFHLKDTGVDGRIILKCKLKKEDGRVQIAFICHRIGTIVGLL